MNLLIYVANSFFLFSGNFLWAGSQDLSLFKFSRCSARISRAWGNRAYTLLLYRWKFRVIHHRKRPSLLLFHTLIPTWRKLCYNMSFGISLSSRRRTSGRRNSCGWGQQKLDTIGCDPIYMSRIHPHRPRGNKTVQETQSYSYNSMRITVHVIRLFIYDAYRILVTEWQFFNSIR